MELKKDKLVRFYDNEKQDVQFSWEKSDTQKHSKEYKVSAAAAPLLIPEGSTAGGVRAKLHRFGSFKVFPESHEPYKKKILDPGSDIFLQWNRIFLFSCLVALFVDPLFLYLPSVLNDGSSSCVATDLNLGIVVTCFRTLADMFYLLHMFIKLRTAYVSPSSRVFGRGELVMDPEKIARRYLRTDFFIDLIATLPLPQIVIWFIIPAVRSSHSTNNALVLIVLLQYVPRLYLIFPLSSQIIKATGVVVEYWLKSKNYFRFFRLVGRQCYGLLSAKRRIGCFRLKE